MSTAARPAMGTVTLPSQASDADQWVRRRITVIWALLFWNGMAYTSGLLPIPRQVGQLMTVGALGLAFVLALSLNRRLVLRPNAVLTMLTLLAGSAFIASARFLAGPGSLVRSVRLLAFVAVLWLLTPWWGRRDLLLARCHFRALLVVLSTVVAGLLVAPGFARPQGRLAGILWPIPPPQVAHYAAVAAGVALVLWMSNRMRRLQALSVAGGGFVILLLTQTRTALIALVAGSLCAALSLFLSRRRVRRAALIVVFLLPVAAPAVAPTFLTWFNRNQSAEERSALTGRKNVWEGVVAAPRSELTQWVGLGLSDKSFDGLSIDSTWYALYHDEGLVGVVLVAGIMVLLLVKVVARPPGPERALAAFLLVYCAVASYTEVGPGDATPYTLSLVVAASLLASTPRAEHVTGELDQ